jgi:hypothetical protein
VANLSARLPPVQKVMPEASRVVLTGLLGSARRWPPSQRPLYRALSPRGRDGRAGAARRGASRRGPRRGMAAPGARRPARLDEQGACRASPRRRGTRSLRLQNPDRTCARTPRLFPRVPALLTSACLQPTAVTSPCWLHKVRLMATLPNLRSDRTRSICVSLGAGTIAASSTDQPVRAALSAAARTVRQTDRQLVRPGLALDHERSGSHWCAQAVGVMATRPSR